jgi:hypothetical protein
LGILNGHTDIDNERRISMIYRQGDVLLKGVKNIPVDSKPVKNDGKVILAKGAVTGHAHTMPALACMLFMQGNRRFLDVKNDSVLSHQEHGPITIPAGNFEVIIQREYTPEEIRNVAD